MKGKQSKDCQPSSLAKRESHTQVQSQMLLECSGTEEFVPFAGPAPSLRPLDEKSSVRKLQGGVRTHMVAFHSFQFISIHFNSFQFISIHFKGSNQLARYCCDQVPRWAWDTHHVFDGQIWPVWSLMHTLLSFFMPCATATYCYTAMAMPCQTIYMVYVQYILYVHVSNTKPTIPVPCMP